MGGLARGAFMVVQRGFLPTSPRGEGRIVLRASSFRAVARKATKSSREGALIAIRDMFGRPALMLVISKPHSRWPV